MVTSVGKPKLSQTNNQTNLGGLKKTSLFVGLRVMVGVKERVLVKVTVRRLKGNNFAQNLKKL